MGRRVAVIGAGAAGTMAAIFAATRGADVALLERTRDGGRKILISGGGRCNVLPARLDETRFITDSSPNTLRNIVRSWPLHEQIAFFENEVHVPLVEEAESAKLFPASHRARDVRDGLLSLAAERGAVMVCNRTVTDLQPAGTRWRIDFSDGTPLEVDAVIVAAGGLSVPNTGSDGTGFRLLEALGHTINTPYAALTPILAQPAPFGDLSGISLDVRVTATHADRKAQATGGFLFTHHGYSGPAVLDVSHVVVRGRAIGGAPPAAVTVAWTDRSIDEWEAAFRPDGARTVGGVVRRELPVRLADALIQRAEVEPGRLLAQLTRAERTRLVSQLTRAELPWTGDDGYRKAEVTGGGVSLAEIHPKTMESKRHPGLYLAGEVLDAFGPIGGYNFLWAWVTGRAAGLAV